jgi:hypothetical protein
MLFVVCSCLALNVHAMPKAKKTQLIVNDKNEKSAETAKISAVVNAKPIESTNPLVRK